MDKVVFDALEELMNYNYKLIPAVQKTVENLRAQREDLALDLLVVIINGLQWDVEVLFRTKEELKKLGVEIKEDEINNVLRELVEAMENQDYVLLADILEYEVLVMLEVWQRGIEKGISN